MPALKAGMSFVDSAIDGPIDEARHGYRVAVPT